MRILLCLLLVFIPIHVANSTPKAIVKLHQAESLNVNQAEIDDVWQFVKKITHTDNITPPQIFFISFNPIVAGKLWTDWQERWKRRNGMKSNPSMNKFDGYAYWGTVVIQINPDLFRGKNGPLSVVASMRHDGNYVIGHEMLHYVFGLKGVPGFLEHCIMDIGKFEESLIKHIYGTTIGTSSYKGICEKIPIEYIQCGIEQVLGKSIDTTCYK